MEKKTVSGIMLSLLVISTLTLAFNIQPVKASGTIYIRPDGSIDPPTAPIQRDGDVYTFTDNINDQIVVERSNIIIDGAGYKLQGLGSGTGLYLYGSNNVTIKNTEIKNFLYGIWLLLSSNNNIYGNNITNNSQGIYLSYSSKNTLRSNAMLNNKFNFGVWGWSLPDFVNDIDASNTVDSKPVYYWINRQNVALPMDAGYVALINCTRIEVQNLNLTKNYQGVLLAFTSNSTIAQNSIKKNSNGIRLEGSSGNTISGNNLTDNHDGILLYSSLNNSLTGNNITMNNYDGISLSYSSGNSIYGNNVTANNHYGIYLYSSLNNSLYGNNITTNYWSGILLYSSSNNSIRGNNLTANYLRGILLYSSYNNSVSGSNIANNHYGVRLYSSSNNRFYHNNFVNNTQQVRIDTPSFANLWDDGYPSGGNYWSDYTGVDEYQGANQDVLGNDGIIDAPYVIDENNQDRYPYIVFIKQPFPWGPHDIGITNVITSKTVVGSGFKLSVNITIFNYGNNTEAFDVTLNASAITIGTRNITLANRKLTTITFTWDTTGFAKGNYTLSAYATQVPSETDLADNTYTNGIVTITIPGDINGDGWVDGMDLTLMGMAWGSTIGQSNYNPNTDINSDGWVDGSDLTIMGFNWGQYDP